MGNSIRDFMDTVGKEIGEAKTYSQIQKIMGASGLERLGSGSSRIAYKLDDDHVVKIAKNEFGLMQNSTETDFFIQDAYSDFLTKTKEYDDENYRFVISEYATKLKSDKEFYSKIEENFSISKEEFTGFIENIDRLMLSNDKNAYQNIDKILEDKDETHFFHKLKDMCLNTSILPGDFTRRSSWGVVKDGDSEKLAIKDYGLTVQNHAMYVTKKTPQPKGPSGPYF